MPAKDYAVKVIDGQAVASGTCVITDQVYSVSVPVEQYTAWREGALIQRAMPQLTNAEREFFMTGITGAEWESMFADDDDDDDWVEDDDQD